MEPDLTQWPTIHEAARSLRTSTRSVLRAQDRGEVEIRKRTRPRKKPENVVNPDDLQKLIEAEAPRPFPVQLPAPTPKAAPTYPPGLDDFIHALVSAARARPEPAAIAPPAVPLHLKLRLTIEEAAAYSGYSEHKIRMNIEAGNLEASQDGPRGKWIIRRASLEEWSSK